jgi:BlaI family transcriptional regulator, penicillinase repressor
MARPKHITPTPGEMEILDLLWDRGPSTVRQVLEVLEARRPRAYTSVMTLLKIMTNKGLVVREPHGRAFMYRAARPRGKTLGRVVKDLLDRVFKGSADQLVVHVLNQSKPSPEELDQIRQAIDAYRGDAGGDDAGRNAARRDDTGRQQEKP